MAKSSSSSHLITKSQAARLKGFHPAQITRDIKSGKLPGAAIVGIGIKAKIDVSAARQYFGAAQQDEIEPNSTKPGHKSSTEWDDAGTRLRHEQAENWALKNAEMRGELISAADARARWAAEMTAWRSRLLGFVVNLPSRLPGLSQHDLSIIDRSLRDLMTDFADGASHE